MSSPLSKLLPASFTNPLFTRSIPIFISSTPRRAYTNNRNDSTTEQWTEGEKYLYEKLSKRLNPTKLHVQDISGGCGSMYSIEISSDLFKGLPTIKQHRMVNELLEEDIKKMHGIQLKTSAS